MTQECKHPICDMCQGKGERQIYNTKWMYADYPEIEECPDCDGSGYIYPAEDFDPENIYNSPSMAQSIAEDRS